MPLLRVAVLVDLPREAASGGHVKYWERMAQAAAKENADIDMTVYFSGAGADEILSPHVRFRFLPPVFSTARLKFLPYVPAHTDLAPFHPKLAQELPDYDVIHTTDGFFSFARTAERVARWHGIPLVTSLHTDTPAYAELFTRQTLAGLFGRKGGERLDRFFSLSARERRGKEKRLKTHLKNCAAILAMRPEDIALAQSVAAADKIKPMRLGVDKDLFAPCTAARAEVERAYAIALGKFIVLFVGRVDAGKNMPTLLQACAGVIGKGVRLHLIVAGLGPMNDEVKRKLGNNVTLAGLIETKELARLYAAADCLAIASDIEIGGMIAPEALACGCPVLVSRQSGVAQLCGDTPAMRKVESNPAAWVDSLADFAQDAVRRAAMREAALSFRRDRIAGWGDVLREDFMPVWQKSTSYREKIMFGKRILILVAHPDDEVVACAASIARARAQGATISSLYLTQGCIARETLWPWQRKDYDSRVARRHIEAESAALLLGIQPVGWASRPARYLWREMAQVFQEVNAAITQYRPDQIWVPAYEGGNPDHDALNAIGAKFRTRLSVLEFAEYNFFGGEAQSNSFVSSEGAAQIVLLTPEERAAKRAALELYASEKDNLSAMGTAQENYRPLALYDYAQPPHQGKLWYERFQWVPFRHPRIDRTKAAEVSKTITSFL